jgi:hypothetical protein
MIEIFIPVLWICVNAKCEFMQADGFYFTNEAECMASLDVQKERMTKMVEQTPGKITVMEGTCADAKIKFIKSIDV